MLKKNFSSSLIMLSTSIILSSNIYAFSLFNEADDANANNKKGVVKIIDTNQFNKNLTARRKCFMSGQTSCDGVDMSNYYLSDDPRNYWKNTGSSFATKQTEYLPARTSANSGANSNHAAIYDADYSGYANYPTDQGANNNNSTATQGQAEQPDLAQEPQNNQSANQNQAQEQRGKTNSSSILLGAGDDSNANNNHGFVIG